MAYDLFPRLWLTDILLHGYDGRYREELERLMERGAVTSLFMQSPTGELPAGGRSAAHQWNEAQQAAAFEMMARLFWNRNSCAAASRDTACRMAAAFKRAAHLATGSINNWVRASGELWIVKNRFAPEKRAGYESYSFHSQYNLLAAAMLAIAWRHAEEQIPEGTAPAEWGGFAFSVRNGFDKVFANAGGSYVEYDLNADAHYNPTGILRVHFRGHRLLSDGAVAHPTYGTGGGKPTRSLALGPIWNSGGKWSALAGRARSAANSPSVTIGPQTKKRAGFTVRYENSGCPVTEQVTLRPGALRIRSEIACAERVGATIPFLVSDGERELARVPRVRLLTAGATLRRLNLREPSRYGLLDSLEAQASGTKIEYEVRIDSLSPPGLRTKVH